MIFSGKFNINRGGEKDICHLELYKDIDDLSRKKFMILKVSSDEHEQSTHNTFNAVMKMLIALISAIAILGCAYRLGVNNAEAVYENMPPEIPTIIDIPKYEPQPAMSIDPPIVDEDIFIPEPVQEIDPWDNAPSYEMRITYYCAEKYKHICGTGDGITYTGTVATPGRTVAVDPKLIPLGSQVRVDFGDGDVRYYVAEDIGGGVKKKHIDICSESHKEALSQTKTRATVSWIVS